MVDEKLAEWQGLARIGWMYMSVEQFKDVLQALNELLVRDAQWKERWMGAVDSLDLAYEAGIREGIRTIERDTETYDYRRGYADGLAAGKNEPVHLQAITDDELHDLRAEFEDCKLQVVIQEAARDNESFRADELNNRMVDEHERAERLRELLHEWVEWHTGIDFCERDVNLDRLIKHSTDALKGLPDAR